MRNRRKQLDVREWVNQTEEFLGYPQQKRTIRYRVERRLVGTTLDRPLTTLGVERPPQI